MITLQSPEVPDVNLCSVPVAVKLEINVGTESNSSTDYYGQDFAINIRADKGESPNDEGNGTCFTHITYVACYLSYIYVHVLYTI